MKAIGAGVLAATMVFASTAIAQEQPAKAADNMQILMDKVRADKKLLVANNMKLTEEEAKAFWPVYDAYQKDLQALNARYEKGLKAYADAYNKGPVANETAKQLLDEMLAIDEAEVQLKRSFVPKLEKALPMSKVARYLQLETKIRSAVRYDLSRRIPLLE
jgi:Spy/CpxP family protein refolding chaperone